MPRLTAVSGYGVKGPACFVLEIAGRRLMLDLGRGPDHDAAPDLTGVGPVDAILISHAHADHVGALALAAGVGSPPVYATALASAMTPALDGAPPMPLRGSCSVADVTVETGAAGHAPGAVWMRIGGEEGLLYTGDCNDEGGIFAVDPMPKAAALVFDASYGVRTAGLAEQRRALSALAEGGPLLLVAPAGGRGLDMALACLEAGHVVALCPAHRRVARVLAQRDEGLVPGAREALAALLRRSRPLEEDTPPEGVMLATAPNADRGLAATLAPRFAGSRAARVVLSGHVAAGSPAEALLAAGRAERIGWNVHPALPAQQAILRRVAPRVAMAAFLRSADLPDLRDALARNPLAAGPIMDW